MVYRPIKKQQLKNRLKMWIKHKQKKKDIAELCWLCSLLSVLGDLRCGDLCPYLWRPLSLCHYGDLCPYVTVVAYVFVTVAAFDFMSLLRPMSLCHRGDPCPYVTVETYVLMSLLATYVLMLLWRPYILRGWLGVRLGGTYWLCSSLSIIIRGRCTMTTGCPSCVADVLVLSGCT